MEQLKSRGIVAESLNSKISAKVKKQILADLASEKPQLKLLYIMYQSRLKSQTLEVQPKIDRLKAKLSKKWFEHVCCKGFKYIRLLMSKYN